MAEAPTLALKDFNEAVRLDPKRANALSGRGAARATLGQYRLAITDAEESLGIGPNSPRLLYNAARVYAQAASTIEAEAKRDNRNAGIWPAQWQDRALKLLQQTLEMQSPAEGTTFWETYVQNDPALHSVRQKYAFKQMVSRYAHSSR